MVPNHRRRPLDLMIHPGEPLESLTSRIHRPKPSSRPENIICETIANIKGGNLRAPFFAIKINNQGFRGVESSMAHYPHENRNSFRKRNSTLSLCQRIKPSVKSAIDFSRISVSVHVIVLLSISVYCRLIIADRLLFYK